MQRLKERILKDGHLRAGHLLKVDSFLNHQIDVSLLAAIGERFHALFQEQSITKVMTIEASGIAVAVMTALAFDVPVLFAKKTQSIRVDPDVYESEVFSYTKNSSYKIRVSKRYLTPQDRILIVDDFLARGSAVQGMMAICKDAKAQVCGVGAVIEKGFQGGGDQLRAAGIQLESLAIIDAMDLGTGIQFREN